MHSEEQDSLGLKPNCFTNVMSWMIQYQPYFVQIAYRIKNPNLVDSVHFDHKREREIICFIQTQNMSDSGSRPKWNAQRQLISFPGLSILSVLIAHSVVGRPGNEAAMDCDQVNYSFTISLSLV